MEKIWCMVTRGVFFKVEQTFSIGFNSGEWGKNTIPSISA